MGVEAERICGPLAAPSNRLSKPRGGSSGYTRHPEQTNYLVQHSLLATNLGEPIMETDCRNQEETP